MQQPVEIRPVKSRHDFKTFVKLPWKINAGDPCWVPPLLMDRYKVLNREKNPFFRHNPAEFYLAFRNGEPVGRIAAITNRLHNEYHKDKAGFFGFLEAVEDPEVFAALLKTVEKWLKERGCDKMLGPMNPSTNDEVGFLIEGFTTPPYLMMPHNPPYYDRVMRELGYTKAKDLYAYLLNKDILPPLTKLERVSQAILKRKKVTLRPLNMKNFKDELEFVRTVYNDAWSRNWGFVPMTPEEFDFVANDFKQIIDPELALVAEYEGEPAGFALSLPNYNEVFAKIPSGRLFPTGIFTFLTQKKKIHSIRVITLGVRQKYQHLGLSGLFIMETIQRGIRRGYDTAELSWILEDNDLMNRPLIRLKPNSTKNTGSIKRP